MRAFVGATWVAALLILGTTQRAEAQPPGAPVKQTPEVSVITIKPEAVTLTTELPGRTSAYQIAEVRPQVNGVIQKRLFVEGSDVKAGDVLYLIDPATYQAAYDNAKASQSKAEANLLPVQLKAERNKQLVAEGAISQQESDDASASLKQANADIEYAKAGVQTAKINLEYTKVTAPISGRIGRSAVTVGALAKAYQDAAFATIQQMDPIYVDASQSSAEMLRLNRNRAAGKLKVDTANQATVKLLLEDGTPYPQDGKLNFSDVTVDQGTGSVVLRMSFPNPTQTLLPGMYVRAILTEGAVDDAILVPQSGITRNTKGNPTAMVVPAGSDKVEQRILKTERTVGDKWLVSDGLKAGDQVVMEGLQNIHSGDTVKVTPYGVKVAGTPAGATTAK
ncbi:TPA: efflux transporter periplasmic adaptor subunit [Candidatus Sumerlaeota bacterium]|nr:efflux transporter periplasmic adaptor subunit [Candidatus Sumerlaeota bacterium]